MTYGEWLKRKEQEGNKAGHIYNLYLKEYGKNPSEEEKDLLQRANATFLEARLDYHKLNSLINEYKVDLNAEIKGIDEYYF